MHEENNQLHSEISRISKIFLEEIKEKTIQIISHFDTDGISSAAIMINCLKKLDQSFTLKIVKNLSEEIIDFFFQENQLSLLTDF